MQLLSPFPSIFVPNENIQSEPSEVGIKPVSPQFGLEASSAKHFQLYWKAISSAAQVPLELGGQIVP